MVMKKKNLIIILGQLIIASAFFGCQSSEDISRSYDMEVPTCKVQNDSAAVVAGSTVELNIRLSDNAGLSKVEFAYDAWSISESVNLADQGNPTLYQYKVSVKVPTTALKSWSETVYRNDGSSYVTTQAYHKLVLKVYDVNGNVRIAYTYLKVNN